MTLLTIIRHGATKWNEDGKVQSTTDVPLSVAGRRTVKTWKLPDNLANFEWVSSPLTRAIETAKLLSGQEPSYTDERLVEMDWSIWEGMTIAELKSNIGNLGKAWRAGGLDFKAPGGESQRDVQKRLLSFYREVVDMGRPKIIVCHRGIIRATYSLAVGWNQKTPWPTQLSDNCAQIFRLERNGHPKIEKLNVPLTAD